MNRTLRNFHISFCIDMNVKTEIIFSYPGNKIKYKDNKRILEFRINIFKFHSLSTFLVITFFTVLFNTLDSAVISYNDFFNSSSSF